jgi:hypothetical protein
MQLTFPSAFFWLLLALPLAALYLLKVRPRQQVVSTLWWWQQVIPDSLPRRWWHRLRHPLSLLAQLTLLALMVLALSEPYWNQRPRERRMIVILDNSVSMQATDVASNRLALAKRRVRHLIDGLRGDDRMALITAGTTARLAHELTAHQRSLRRALAQVPATDGPGLLADALELASRMPGAEADRELVVVTDPAGRAAAESNPLAADVHWLICGSHVDNVGITRYQTRRQNIDPLGFECLVEVTSFALEPRKCQLSLRLDGEPIDALPLELPPQQSVVRVLTYASATGGTLEATLNIDDALAADNRAVAWLTPRLPRRVTLVTTGNWYLQKVLQAIPLVDLQVSQKLLPADGNLGVPILHNVAIDALPAGRSMIVQPSATGSLWQVGEPLPDGVIGYQHPHSSLVTHVNLQELPVRGGHHLQLPPETQVLAATLAGEPVYAIVPHPAGEVLVLNIDVQQGDFPWRTEFPLVMANAVNWLVGQSASFQSSYAAGDVVSLDAWPDTSPGLNGSFGAAESAQTWGSVRQIETPNGQLRRAPHDRPFTRIGPLDQAGMWTLWPIARAADAAHIGAGKSRDSATDAASSGPFRLGCNVVNRQESDLRWGRSDAPRLAGMGSAGHPFWFYLITVALLLLAVEWWLFQRRWIS